MHFTISLFLCSLLTLSAFADSPIDPCTRLKSKPTLESARACLSVFPYDTGRHEAIEKVVKGVAQMYVFGEISKNSPDKTFQPDYDLYAALDKVFAKKDYQNDMEFQEAISSTFLPLNDEHMAYYPDCYRQLTYYQPFYPTGIVDKEGKTRIMIYGISHSRYEKYLGGEIVEIYNRPAAEFIWDWAFRDNVGSYKDSMSRVNKALARMVFDSENKWKPLPGEFMSRRKIPKEDSVKYSILPPNSTTVVDVEIPWAVKLPSYGIFNSTRYYWRRYCSLNTKFPLKLNTNDSSLISENVLAKNDLSMIKALPTPLMGSLIKRNVRDFKDLENNKEKDGIFVPFTGKYNIRDAIIAGDGVHFYTLKGNEEIGVLMISTFSPINPDDTRYALSKAFQYINKNRVKKLLLDLSNNGGGDGCLASEVIAALIPHLWKTFPTVQNQFNKDIKLSPLTLKLCKAGLEKNISQWNPNYWIDIRTKERFVGEEFFNPPRIRKNGGNATYSQIFQEDCPLDTGNPLLNVTHTIKPRDIVLLSNGLCGSACGRVFFHLSELDNVKAVVTGAYKGVPRSGAGFPATQVLKYESVVKDLKRLELSADEDAFGYLPVEASLRFSARESYSRRKRNMPLEFLFIPAEYHLDLDNWTALRPDRVWEKAAAILGWIPKKEQ